MGLLLNYMPSEILSNIATHLNAKDALSLSKACRTTRHSCLDPLLFKDLIERQHTLWSFHMLNLDRIARRVHQDANVLARYKYFDLDASRTAHWDKGAFNNTLRQHFGLDLHTWMRYAVADYKAFMLCEQLNGNIWRDGHPCLDHVNEPKISQALQYLPDLLLLKHPSIHASGLVPALMTQIVMGTNPSRPTTCDYPSPIDVECDPRLAFSFCAAMLSQDTPEIPLFRMTSPKAALERFLVNRCKLVELNLQVAADRQRFSSDVTAEPELSQSDAQVLIGAFSGALRRAYREYRIHRLIGVQYYTFVLPLALDVPLVQPASPNANENIALPVPFAANDKSLATKSTEHWNSWHTSQIASLSTSTSLASGVWVGSYSYNTASCSSSAPQTPDFDAPMLSIQFTVSPDGALLATGHDSIGDFTLAGSVSKDGAIRARKIYAGPRGPRWEWWARVTPWGIGGVWGPLLGDDLGAADLNTPKVSGALWLWKESWTSGRAP